MVFDILFLTSTIGVALDRGVKDGPFELTSPSLEFHLGFFIFCFDFEINTEYVDISRKFQLQVCIPPSVSTLFPSLVR